MWLRVADIDFDAPRVHVEVSPDDADDCFVRLDAFVTRCAAEGFPDVQLHYRKGTSRRNVNRLRDFAAMKRLAPPSGRSSVPGGGATHPFPRLPSQLADATGDGHRYQLRIRGTEHAVDYADSAVALIGTSLDLDPKSMLQLRLCVYELATNTVEHGDSPTPEKRSACSWSFRGTGSTFPIATMPSRSRPPASSRVAWWKRSSIPVESAESDCSCSTDSLPTSNTAGTVTGTSRRSASMSTRSTLRYTRGE